LTGDVDLAFRGLEKFALLHWLLCQIPKIGMHLGSSWKLEARSPKNHLPKTLSKLTGDVDLAFRGLEKFALLHWLFVKL
jgi:hypothetical protein